MSYRRIIKNGFAYGLQRGILFSEQFLIIPAYLHFWGVEYYGEWITLSMIPSILSFTDFGFATALSNSFVINYLRSSNKVPQILKTSYLSMLVLILGSVVLSIIFVYISYTLKLFESIRIDKNELYIAFSCLMLAKIFDFLQQFVEGLFRAVKMTHKYVQILNIYLAIRLVVTFFVLFRGGSAADIGIALLILSIIFNFGILYRGLGLIKISIGNSGYLHKNELKSLLFKGASYFSTALWQIIFFQGIVFVIRITLGPASVAMFTSVRMFTRAINQVFGWISSSAFPELQSFIAIEEYASARRIFRLMLLGSILTALIGFGILATLGENIFNKWTSQKIEYLPSFWILMLIASALSGIWWTSGTVYRAFDMPNRFAIYSVTISIVVVVLSVFLGDMYGLLGVASSCVLLELCMIFYVLPTTSDMVGQPILKIPYEMLKDIHGLYLRFSRSYLKNI